MRFSASAIERIRLAGLIIALVAALLAAVRAWAQDRPVDSRVAVLETRADQLDAHLVHTDSVEDKIWAALNDLKLQMDQQQKTLSTMQNDDKWERRIAWSIIVALGSGSTLSARKRLKAVVKAVAGEAEG